MKKQFIQLFFLGIAALSLVACSDSGDSGHSNNADKYYIANDGSCRSKKDRWVVEQSKCDGLYDDGYYAGGNCDPRYTDCSGGDYAYNIYFDGQYCRYNGQIVDYSYCGVYSGGGVYGNAGISGSVGVQVGGSGTLTGLILGTIIGSSL